jgi:hypothetical protein
MNFEDKARDWDKDLQRVEKANVFATEILMSPGNN